MSVGIAFSYILIFFLGCIDHYFHYRFINYIKKDLTTKQKAYILGIKSSLTLVLIGVYLNYLYFSSGFIQEKFFTILEENKTLNFGKLVVLYFTSFLFTDIYIGNTEYPKYMNCLSGNIHHIIYIGINLISLYTGVYPLYLLHMMSELPTFLMDIASFDSSFRNDNLFGLTFFLTRLLYHFVLTIIFRKNKIVLALSLASLGLHIYWFYGWCKRYGSKLFKKPKVKGVDSKSKTKSNSKSKSKSKSKIEYNTKIKLKKKR
jgi:hypothetical protein